jgi:hypothetical protein
VNGPGTVTLIGRLVSLRKNAVWRASTGLGRVMGPTARGTGVGRPTRLIAVPGLSTSSP